MQASKVSLKNHTEVNFYSSVNTFFRVLGLFNEINDSTENFGGRVQFNQFFSWDWKKNETIAVVMYIIF